VRTNTKGRKNAMPGFCRKEALEDTEPKKISKKMQNYTM